jgi:hypothetical protein
MQARQSSQLTTFSQLDSHHGINRKAKDHHRHREDIRGFPTPRPAVLDATMLHTANEDLLIRAKELFIEANFTGPRPPAQNCQSLA